MTEKKHRTQELSIASREFWTPEAMAVRAAYPYHKVLHMCSKAGSVPHQALMKQYEKTCAGVDIKSVYESYPVRWSFTLLASALGQGPQEGVSDFLEDGFRLYDAWRKEEAGEPRAASAIFDQVLQEESQLISLIADDKAQHTYCDMVRGGAAINDRGEFVRESTGEPLHTPDPAKYNNRPRVRVGGDLVAEAHIKFMLSRMTNVPEKTFQIDHIIEGKDLKHHNQPENLCLTTDSLNKIKLHIVDALKGDRGRGAKNLLWLQSAGLVLPQTMVDGIIQNFPEAGGE